jgi:preprotein translocase subunit SecE
MGPNKAVHIMFLSGGVLLFIVANLASDWALGYFTRSPSQFAVNGIAAAVALFAGFVLYRNDRVYGLASDVASELEKVTWPTKKETQAATMVVIVTVIIAAIILGVFDFAWSKITDLIYG